HLVLPAARRRPALLRADAQHQLSTFTAGPAGRLVAAVLSGGSSLLLTRQRPAADGFVLENWRPVR
ncbi:hypothetical protein ACWDNT_25040, partial [Streptomyces sp. NPDC000963]